VASFKAGGQGAPTMIKAGGGERAAARSCLADPPPPPATIYKREYAPAA